MRSWLLARAQFYTDTGGGWRRCLLCMWKTSMRTSSAPESLAPKFVRPPSTTHLARGSIRREDVEDRSGRFSQSVADVARKIGAPWCRNSEQAGASASPAVVLPGDSRGGCASLCRLLRKSIRMEYPAWDTARPSFDDATGNVSGAWVTGRAPPAIPACCRTSGWTTSTTFGADCRPRAAKWWRPAHHDHPDGSTWIATFRDPAGNLIGLYQECRALALPAWLRHYGLPALQ